MCWRNTQPPFSLQSWTWRQCDSLKHYHPRTDFMVSDCSDDSIKLVTLFCLLIFLFIFRIIWSMLHERELHYKEVIALPFGLYPLSSDVWHCVHTTPEILRMIWESLFLNVIFYREDILEMMSSFYFNGICDVWRSDQLVAGWNSRQM
jgi:hypothetical protein